MAKIKKAYAEIIEFLTENADKKVSTILDDVIGMASAKAGGGASGGATTVRRDEDGNVVAVFCYYHKQWEDISVAEYGAKASSATGLNNMCKEGVSQYTKQQRAAKKANEELLQRVADGEVKVGEIATEQAALDEARYAIVAREDGHGDD